MVITYLGYIVKILFLDSHAKILQVGANFDIFIEPVPNSKSISVLGKSKSKSYFVFQYWASLKKSLTSLTSLGQDLGNTCKLIPKSNPTFQKNSSEIFEFKKISQRATILALLFGHFPGVLENDAGGIPN